MQKKSFLIVLTFAKVITFLMKSVLLTPQRITKNMVMPVLMRWSAISICLCFPVLTFAETVLLKSGKTIEGEIIEKTGDYIKIDFQGVPLTFFKAEIESIDGQKSIVETNEINSAPIESNESNNEISDNTDSSEIFEKVIAAYQSMETYKAEGAITSDVDAGGIKIAMSTEFSMVLKKPNLYLISWTQKNMAMPGMVQSGAVWNDGTQAYLYMGGGMVESHYMGGMYSKIANDELALASAMGISGGAAFTIPSVFLSVFKEKLSPFDRLKNVKLEKIEDVENEECYVISARSAISKEETFWISKSKYLIIKYARSLEAPEGGRTMPEMTDEQLEEAMKGMGQEVTVESKQRMREMMNKQREVLETTEMKGSTTELHVQISSPELSTADFQFALPEGAVLKESLFGGAFSGSEQKE